MTASPAPGPAPVSVPRVVAAFLAAALVVLAAVGAGLAVAQHRIATSEAIRDARTLTNLEAVDVVGPWLTDAALVPGPAQEALAEVVRHRVLGSHIVRVKIWDETGTIRFSDDQALVGLRFPLPPSELAALHGGRVEAEVSDLQDPENRDERHFGKLLQVYLGVRTPGGRPLLFETYQPYQVITDASGRMWLTSLPVLLAGLVLLYLLQAPLAVRMARRLRASQEERERLLLASLAASDRERGRIAADLHDGIVQGLAGTSMSLTAAAARAPEAAPAMLAAAGDLRRWVRELRSLVVTITPPALHAQGLAVSLRDLAATLEGRDITVDVTVELPGPVPAETETLLYRAAQEALRNVVRHAGASRVGVSLRAEGTRLVLEVVDDGKGFAQEGQQARSRGSVGLDLLGALVAGEAGVMTVTSAPGEGTRLRVELPRDGAR